MVSSLPLGALFTAIGLAWVVIFRNTKVLNFASGQFAILGGYIVYVLTGGPGLNWWIAAAIAVAAIACLGATTYTALLRPLAGRPLWSPVILLMGLSFVLDSIISMLWGDRTIHLDSPVPDRVFHLPGNATLNSRDLVAIGGSLSAFLAVFGFLRLSSLGARMRAAAESPLLASQSAINIDRMFALGWAMSASVAAIGGIGYSLTTVLTPTLASIGIVGLTPALLGGLDSVGGVIVGGFGAALVTNMTILYLGAPALNAVAALIVLIVLVVRPFGLFGTPAIERV